MRFIYIAIASITLFFPAFWLFSQAVGDNWGAGIAAVAMYLAFPILMMKIWPEPKRLKEDTMYEAIEAGVLSSQEYEIKEAVEITEFEDEGCHYLLDIRNNKTLVLAGQYLYAAVESGKFPSSKIRIYWHSTEGYTFGIECLGNNILTSRTIEPKEEIIENSMLADRELLDQPLVKVVELIGSNA
jgi:hypothetical protein